MKMIDITTGVTYWDTRVKNSRSPRTSLMLFCRLQDGDIDAAFVMHSVTDPPVDVTVFLDEVRQKVEFLSLFFCAADIHRHCSSVMQCCTRSAIRRTMYLRLDVLAVYQRLQFSDEVLKHLRMPLHRLFQHLVDRLRSVVSLLCVHPA